MCLTLHFTEDQIDFLHKALPDFLHEAEEFKKQFVSLLTFEFVHRWPESMDEEESRAGMPSKATAQRIMMAMRQLDFEQTPYVPPTSRHAQHQRAARECWTANSGVCCLTRPSFFESRHTTSYYHIQSHGMMLQTCFVPIRFGLAEQAHIAQAAMYWKRAAREGQDTERCYVLLFLKEHLKLFQIPLRTGISLAKATAIKKLVLVRHLQWSYWTSLTIARLADASEEPPYPALYDTHGRRLRTLYKHAQREAASEQEVAALNRLLRKRAGPSTLRKKQTGNAKKTGIKKTGNVYVLQEYYEAEYERLVAEEEQWALANGLASTIK
ncbi:hypothetical protein ARMSODRAFT_1023808 [Armillaria solidipes]|uniref:Uncharacterized protein n=1 Tax=Armillaria solidipes TaxID=1076256 RepID=A0A2H3BGA4_9AGAR|nr:hypothetical protein ARMSODRAFT_1023808 [Armillaria solidipes]